MSRMPRKEGIVEIYHVEEGAGRFFMKNGRKIGGFQMKTRGLMEEKSGVSGCDGKFCNQGKNSDSKVESLLVMNGSFLRTVQDNA